MEPMVLCGIVIVIFGLWIEGEALAAWLVRSFCCTALVKGIVAMATAERKPVFENRYVAYSPR